MIHANLHINADTRIIWSKASETNAWVELTHNGNTVVIFVNSEKDALRLVQTLWTIRHNLVNPDQQVEGLDTLRLGVKP